MNSESEKPRSVKLIFHIRKGLLEVRVGVERPFTMLADSGGGAGSETWSTDKYGRKYRPYVDGTLVDNPDTTWLPAPTPTMVRPNTAPKAGFEGKDWVLGWRGGAIPVGYWWIKKPKGSSFKRRARLEPYLVRWPNHVIRTALEIHFWGTKGSDGCIVPRNRSDFPKLMDVLCKAREPKKGYAGFLHVLAG